MQRTSSTALIVVAAVLGMACFGSLTYLAGRVLGVW
jgi:hypothetical protein